MFDSRLLTVLALFFATVSDAALMVPPFNLKVKPCESLYHHVCPKVEHNDEAGRAIFENSLTDEAIKFIAYMKDPIFDLIVQVIRNGGHRNPSKCSDMELETTDSIGKALAYGKLKEVYMECVPKWKDCQLWSSEKPGYWHHYSYSSIRDKKLKKILDDYLRLIDPEKKINRSELTFGFRHFDLETMPKMNEDLQNFAKVDPSRAHFETDIHEVLFRNKRFSPYFNLAYSKVLLEKKVYVSEESIQELRDMYRLVMDELLEKVNNSAVVTDSSRDTINRHFRNVLKLKIGLAEQFYNTSMVEKHMNVYRRHLRNFDPRGECGLEMLAREINLVRNRLVVEANGKRMNPRGSHNHDTTIHDHNAYYSSISVYFLPSYIHILKRELSIGMKYGIIGWTIGHELSHGLGLEGLGKHHLHEVRKTEGFRKGVKCFKEYYGSFCTGHPGECPEGSHKKEEGYPDVEGARAAFSVLKKVLASKTGRDKRSSIRYPRFNSVPLNYLRSELRYNELQWFFIALAFKDCRANSDRSLFQSYKPHNHPRSSIRANAIVMQMPEFSEVFNCSCSDRMYHEELCEVYPPAGKKNVGKTCKSSNYIAINRIAGTANVEADLMNEAPLSWITVFATFVILLNFVI